MKILILSCYSRNGLAVINSIDSSYELIGATRKLQKHFLFCPDKIFRSNRLSGIIRYGDPQNNPEGFRDDIIAACNELKIDAVFPAGTLTTNMVSKYKKEISERTNAKMLVEDYEKLDVIADKWKTYQLCVDIGVPVPRTELVTSSEEMLNVADELKFPIILKPRSSSGSDGIMFMNMKNEFIELVKSPTSSIFKNSNYILQEIIEGDLHDVTSCSDQGRVVSILSQKRLVTMNDFGGGGIINITTNEPKMREDAERLIKHLGWSGILEFDFIKSEDNKYYLIECNPKVWGTTQLTVDAGLNVIQQNVDIYLHNKNPERITEYKIGLLYKWIFPECVGSWIQEPRRLSRIAKRIINTFKSYKASESLNNIRKENILHIIGNVFNR
jgi:predicted ATP-grasp superfamily ATP-dependent carboligase